MVEEKTAQFFFGPFQMGKYKKYSSYGKGKPFSTAAKRYLAQKALNLAANRAKKLVQTRLNFKAKKYAATGKGKTKRRGGNTIVHDHDGINMTSHLIVLNKRKSKRKVTNWHTYQQQNTENLTGAAGAQGIGLINIDFSQFQLNNPDPSYTTGAAPNEYYLPLYNYNYQAGAFAIVGGNYATPQGAGGRVVGQDMFIKQVYYDLMIGNASNMSMVLDLYCVVSKKSLPPATVASYSATWDPRVSGLMDEVVNMILQKRSNISKPVAANPTIASGTYTGPSFGDYGLTTYGFNPFQLKGFRDAYKCKFHKKISLDGGAVHKFNIKMIVNKWINEETVRTANTNNYIVEGLTTQWFVVMRGAPGVVETAGAGSSNSVRQVTPAATQISWTLSKKITFGFAQGNTAQENWVSPGFPLVSGTTTVKIINSEDAEVNQYVLNEADTS